MNDDTYLDVSRSGTMSCSRLSAIGRACAGRDAFAEWTARANRADTLGKGGWRAGAWVGAGIWRWCLSGGAALWRCQYSCLIYTEERRCRCRCRCRCFRLGYKMGCVLTHLDVGRVVWTVSCCGNTTRSLALGCGLTCSLFAGGCDCAGSTTGRGRWFCYGCGAALQA